MADDKQTTDPAVPEQVQLFTPTPSTWSTAMYCTGLDPATGQPVVVERGGRARENQKAILTAPSRGERSSQ